MSVQVVARGTGGCRVLSLGEVQSCEAKPGVRKASIGSDGRSVLGDGPSQVSDLFSGSGRVVASCRVVRPDCQRPIEMVKGLARTSLPEEDPPLDEVAVLLPIEAQCGVSRLFMFFSNSDCPPTNG